MEKDFDELTIADDIAKQCTSMYILGLRVCNANLLLHRTTAIHGGIDTSSIFSSGTDAARIMQKRCFGTAETRCQKCTRMYAFGNVTTQIPAYFKRTEKLFAVYAIIRYNGLSDAFENFNFLDAPII